MSRRQLPDRHGGSVRATFDLVAPLGPKPTAMHTRDSSGAVSPLIGHGLGAGARAMVADRGNFYAFARHLGIQLTPAIASVDEEYLGMKRKSELVDLLHMAGFIEVRNDWIGKGRIENTEVSAVDKLKLDKLVAACLAAPVVEAVGVPRDVRALYETLKPAIDPDVLEDETYDLDDQDEEEEADEPAELNFEDDDGEDTPVEEDTDDND